MTRLNDVQFSEDPHVNDLLKSLTIIILATLISSTLYDIGLRVENILMIYAVSILIIVTETQKLLWGVLSAVLCLLLFNFFFTEPRYTLMMDDANHYASLAIFLAAAFLVSTLTTKLKNQIEISRKNEEMTNKLYKMASGYLNLSDKDELVRYSQNCITGLVSKKCRIYLAEEAKESFEELRWCFGNSIPCGFREVKFRSSDKRWLPIKSSHNTVGVLEIQMEGKELSKEEALCLHTAMSQTALALEHNIMRQTEEENRLEIEKEKLRSNLLRSVSHDIRTPLTSIAGSASFLADSFETLDKESTKSLLCDIERDASWLNDMVSNLLNLTRIQDGKIPIRRSNEVVDDVINAAVEHSSKHLGSHRLSVEKPKDIMLVPMDGQLITQVLVNLLDNALKHTDPESSIIVRVKARKNKAVFDVIDDGPGIPKDLKENIFDNFVTGNAGSGDMARGTGLGLSIAKSIVEAHGGTISVKNRPSGGTVFSFWLPCEGVKEND